MGVSLSIRGLYNWNENLFDAMVLPGGIEKSVLVENLCMELAELEVLYADPDFMQQAIGTWSKKELSVWQKFYDTTMFEYNPIHNYDRTEEWIDKTKSVNVGNQSSSGSGNISNSGTDSTQNAVAAFNNNNGVMTPSTLTKATLGTSSSNSSVGNANISGQQDVDNMKTGRAFGNIGVLSTQNMIGQEREIASFNIINYIITSFKNRFCLLVY